MPVHGCFHVPSSVDKARGYEACEYCIETGECPDNRRGKVCATHAVVREVEDDWNAFFASERGHG